MADNRAAVATHSCQCASREAASAPSRGRKESIAITYHSREAVAARSRGRQPTDGDRIIRCSREAATAARALDCCRRFAFAFALDQWRQRNDFQRHRGHYTKVPISRPAFYAVPLRAFDLLWQNRNYKGTIEIDVQFVDGTEVLMEIRADSSEQIYVRPKQNVDYDKLTLINATLPGLELVDGDANPNIQAKEVAGIGLQRLRWARYEIESYLFHPVVIARYVENTIGPGAAESHLTDLRTYFENNWPAAFLNDPLQDFDFLKVTKARTSLIPPALDAAGLPGIPYTRFYEIAALMTPDEIHPEVKEKLDLIQKAFNL